MDSHQLSLVFQAVAVSSLPGFSTEERKTAFGILQELKKFHGRMRLCMSWLLQSPHLYEQHDITLAVKLLALEIMDNFLETGYSQCTEPERLELRRCVLTTSLAQHTQDRVLSRKIAAVLKGLVLRDFPQRWVDMHVDLFGPTLWNDTNGRTVVLEAIKLVAEDCVDADFNSKISTSRRTEVVKGLNEIAPGHFMPLMLQLLESSFRVLQSSKAVLHSMYSYLATEKRTIQSLSVEERAKHQTEKTRRDDQVAVILDTLVALEHLSLTLPTPLFFGKDGTSDFLAAFLHFFREPDLQVQAVACVERLAGRGKLTLTQWKRLLVELPGAFEDANQVYANQEREHKSAETRANGTLNDTTDPLVDQFEYHLGLSRMLSVIINNYVAHLTVKANLLEGKSADSESIARYLRLMSSMLQHPSPRISSEQLTMWSNLYRDPNIGSSKLVQPFVAEVLTRYIDHMERIRWDDIMCETHPQTQLIEASFEEEEGTVYQGEMFAISSDV